MQSTPAPLDTDATQNIRSTDVQHAAESRAVPQVVGYELLDELGRGGMGVVYKAWQRNLQRHVALKMILAGSFAGPQELDRFRAEAMAIARLHHPHLVSIHEIGESSRLPYYAMEYMEGGSLARRLNGEPIAPRVAAQLVRSLAQAMDYAHKNGIIHRDLKPANILLSGDAGAPLENCVAKITDFGIAKLLHQDSNHTRTGDILGTPQYMAPEQATGQSSQIGPAADVYSLGAILYEMLTGRTTYQGHTGPNVLLMMIKEEPARPTQWAPAIPRDLETICMKCLQKDPAKRYTSAGALAEDLLRFVQNEPILARPASALDRAMKWTRRRPATAAILMMSVTLITVAFGLMAGMWRQAVVSSARQDALLLNTRRLLADAFLDRGIHLSENGDVRRGMHWMLRSLEIAGEVEAQTGAPDDLTPAIRLNLAAWSSCATPRELLLRHNDWVWDVAFTRDDRFAVTASKDRNVQVWDAHTGRRVGEPLVHPFPVWGLALHPDGRTLFTICGEYPDAGKGSVHVWTQDAAKPGHFSPRGEPMAFAMALSELRVNAVGDRLWIASHPTGAAHLLAFDAGTDGSGLRRIESPLPGRHRTGEFSHDGRTLATVLADAGERLPATNQVRLWNAATGAPIGAPWTLPGVVRTAFFSLDDRHLIVGSAAGKSIEEGESSLLSVWDVAARKKVAQSPPLQGRIRAAAVAPNGAKVAISMFQHTGRRNGQNLLEITDGHVSLWSIDREGQIRSFGAPLRTGHVVWHLQFTPDSRMLLAGSENSGAYLWSTSNGQRLMPILWHEGNCVRVAFSHDGRTAITASAGGNNNAAARLWEVPQFGHIGPVMTQNGGVRGMYWEKDGSHIWCGNHAGAIRWDPFQGKPIESAHVPRKVRWIMPGPTDRRFLCEVDDHLPTNAHDLREFNGDTGELHTLPNLPPQNRPGAMFTSCPTNGILIESYRRRSYLQLRDLTGGVIGAPLEDPAYELLERCVNPQLTCLAVSQAITTQKSRLVLYDLPAMTVRHVIDIPNRASALAFTPDGKTLAFGGSDRQIQRLDAETGQAVGSPLLHESQVVGACFLQGDRLLMTECPKGLIQLWDARAAKRLGPAIQHQFDLWGTSVHPHGKFLITATTRDVIQLWRFPQPVAGDLPHIRLWVEAITGMEMTPNTDTIATLDRDHVMQKRAELAQMGGAPRQER